MRASIILAVAAAGAGLSACGGGAAVPIYQSLDAALPGAEIRLNKSYTGTGVASAATQAYSFAADEHCDTEAFAASFTWTTGDQVSHRVAPDQPIVIWAVTSYLAGAGVASECRTATRFTPRADRVYDVRHEAYQGVPTCRTRIVDLATGIAPPDVEVLNLVTCHPRDTTIIKTGPNGETRA